MKKYWFSCCLMVLAPFVYAQSGKDSPLRRDDAKNTAAEAVRVLEQARANRKADEQRRAAEMLDTQRVEALAGKLKNAPSPKPSFAEATKQSESDARLARAMSQVAPEGKALLAQSASAPAMRAPDDSAAAKPSPLSTDAAGPRPQPLKATPLDVPEKKPPARTVILAGSSFFDSHAGFGVFVDDVDVDHPQFHMTCDELEVYMNKDEEKKPVTVTPPATKVVTAGELAASGAADKPATAADKDPASRSNGNIKTAIAKGRKVVIRKPDQNGQIQIGICRHATFDGATGDIIMRDYPQIQQGRNLKRAIEPSTIFIIKQNGQIKTAGGRDETVIIQEEEKKAPPPPGATTVAPAAASAAPIKSKPVGGQP